MSKFLYNAACYSTYRPEYPEALFKYLASRCENNSGGLDCGSGNGQAAKGLSSYFKYVIATDLSIDLISHGLQLPNVFYVQSRAEQLAIRSHSIDMICIAQAMHWFSLDNFYNEAKRVLKPGGYIAAWCYNQATINPEIDILISEIYNKISGSTNPSCERQYVYDHYSKIPFPFNRILTPNFTITVNWNLIQLLGYMNTWPGILEYQKKYGINIISEMKARFISVWGDQNNIKIISWPIYLLLGRINL